MPDRQNRLCETWFVIEKIYKKENANWFIFESICIFFFLVLPQHCQCAFLNTDDTFPPGKFVTDTKGKRIGKGSPLYFVFQSLYSDIDTDVTEGKDRTQIACPVLGQIFTEGDDAVRYHTQLREKTTS